MSLPVWRRHLGLLASPDQVLVDLQDGPRNTNDRHVSHCLEPLLWFASLCRSKAAIPSGKDEWDISPPQEIDVCRPAT